ncbi:hypothetical protein [Hymenobacter metallilatus]|uniref:Uncharacterized protein n=1 Tax=Hymenobacter metallilatus TaxID=2493666 RepID=A0A3R9NZW6_9BACT|nr:hypothetical protein [Hymenobacter metallilatus]RSK25214.1 hypothetical protein EI290_17475 [Hymenobacter metallilatus]
MFQTSPDMQVVDIIQMSPKEVFIVGYLAGEVKPGAWELRRNGEAVATVQATGEVQVEAGRKGKLAPPRVISCQGQVDKKQFDFTQDEVTLAPLPHRDNTTSQAGS